jgi:hypothetical protein
MQNQNRISLEIQKRIENTPSDVRENYSDGYHTSADVLSRLNSL